MHALILNGLNGDLDDQPIKTVEEVIKEIDDIMDEAESPLDEPDNCDSEVIEKAREVLGAPLYAESKHVYLIYNIHIHNKNLPQNCNI